jgi:hypothetical protein
VPASDSPLLPVLWSSNCPEILGSGDEERRRTLLRTCARRSASNISHEFRSVVVRICRRPGRGRGVAGWVVRYADPVDDREGRGTDRRCRYDRLPFQAGKDPFGPPDRPIRTMGFEFSQIGEIAHASDR